MEHRESQSDGFKNMHVSRFAFLAGDEVSFPAFGGGGTVWRSDLTGEVLGRGCKTPYMSARAEVSSFKASFRVHFWLNDDEISPQRNLSASSSQVKTPKVSQNTNTGSRANRHSRKHSEGSLEKTQSQKASCNMVC